ncbi:MAG: monovalent cation/H+ antiporter subunit D family protein [Rhodospirillales bacterium]
MTPEQAIMLCIVVPFVGALLVVVTGSLPDLRETMTLISAGILFYLVAIIYPLVAAGGNPTINAIEMLPGLSITFTVEPLGMLFAGIASFLWIVTSVYSIGYMRGHHEVNQTRFYAYFAIAIGSAVGMAFSGNLLTLFIFYEILTLSTFPLVTHHGTEEAKRAGRVYLGLLLGTSIAFLLFAIIWTWVITDSLDFVAGGLLAGKIHGPMVGVLLALYVFGIGKAALMPFHRWLPAAMVAPTPVSALLHAVAVVKAGVFAVVKVVVYVFGVDALAREASAGWLLYVAAFTIIVASVIALRSDNLKRRLAYSTVSQLSYVVIAAAILAPISVVGATLHIAAHAFAKITLFFAAGSILVTSHKTLVSELDGLGRRMPWTMGAFFVGALSMVGVPPTAGFVSKWYILQGALQADQMTAVAVIVLSTLLNAGYFLPIVYAAFFREERRPKPARKRSKAGADDGAHAPLLEHGEAPPTVVAPVVLTAAATVLFFLYPDVALGLARQVAGMSP